MPQITPGDQPGEGQASAASPSLQFLAKREIEVAWVHAGKLSHDEGIELGRVCHKWQTQFSAQGSRKGLGLRPILDEVGIPPSTAYFWIGRYKDATKDIKPPSEKEMREVPLEEALDKFVIKQALAPHGQAAAKFAKYPQQHTAELELLELVKMDIYRQIGEICKTKS
jgi:hypothetical protein